MAIMVGAFPNKKVTPAAPKVEPKAEPKEKPEPKAKAKKEK